MFINLDPNPRQTLRQFLGGVVDMLDKAPLDAFRYSARLTGIVKSNWKSGLDAAREGYHVQTLHRDSAKDMVCSNENPHVRPLSINFMGPHPRQRTETRRRGPGCDSTCSTRWPSQPSKTK